MPFKKSYNLEWAELPRLVVVHAVKEDKKTESTLIFIPELKLDDTQSLYAVS